MGILGGRNFILLSLPSKMSKNDVTPLPIPVELHYQIYICLPICDVVSIESEHFWKMYYRKNYNISKYETDYSWRDNCFLSDRTYFPSHIINEVFWQLYFDRHYSKSYFYSRLSARDNCFLRHHVGNHKDAFHLNSIVDRDIFVGNINNRNQITVYSSLDEKNVNSKRKYYHIFYTFLDNCCVNCGCSNGCDESLFCINYLKIFEGGKRSLDRHVILNEHHNCDWSSCSKDQPGHVILNEIQDSPKITHSPYGDLRKLLLPLSSTSFAMTFISTKNFANVDIKNTFHKYSIVRTDKISRNNTFFIYKNNTNNNRLHALLIYINPKNGKILVRDDNTGQLIRRDGCKRTV